MVSSCGGQTFWLSVDEVVSTCGGQKYLFVSSASGQWSVVSGGGTHGGAVLAAARVVVVARVVLHVAHPGRRHREHLRAQLARQRAVQLPATTS